MSNKKAIKNVFGAAEVWFFLWFKLKVEDLGRACILDILAVHCGYPSSWSQI